MEAFRSGDMADVTDVETQTLQLSLSAPSLRAIARIECAKKALLSINDIEEIRQVIALDTDFPYPHSLGITRRTSFTSSEAETCYRKALEAPIHHLWDGLGGCFPDHRPCTTRAEAAIVKPSARSE